MNAERKRTSGRLLDLLFVLLLIATLVFGVSRLLRLRRLLTSAQTSLGQLDHALAGGEASLAQLLQEPKRTTELQSVITNLDTDLADIEEAAWPLLSLSPYLSWLPGIGGDVEAAPHLLDLARGVTDSARILMDSMAPLVDRLNGTDGGLGQWGPEIVRGLRTARPQIEEAQAALTRGMEARAAISSDRLSSKTKSIVDRVDRYYPYLEVGLQALIALPGLLGADEPQTYLILAQNNHELRATGGFISGVGIVKIDGGSLAEMRFKDSYALDDLNQPHPPAPAALRQYMGAGMLVLRDANWWPDFPSSAQIIANLYHQDQNEVVDGVVAVDLQTLHQLVQVLGPIPVPGYEPSVTADNLQSMLMTYWQAPLLSAPGKEGTDWWLHRKDFSADLLSALLAKLMNQTTSDNLGPLAQAIGSSLRERHLLIYVESKDEQAILRQLDWDGALRTCSGDYLMVVDSNVGFNKVNPNIEQTLDVETVVDKGGAATVRLSLSYRHRIEHPTPACIHASRYGDSYADLLERCYWDHLRIYLPPGSEILEVKGADTPGRVYAEDGRTVIATTFLLETGQARQIQVLYRPNLPPLTQEYSLLVQKQPGTDAIQLRFSITPPEGSCPTAASSEGLVWLGDRGVWQGRLTQDQEIKLAWSQGP